MSQAPPPEQPAVFACKYLGHTTVTHSSGEEVVGESVKQAIKSNRPRKAQLELTSQELVIRDGRVKHGGGDVLQQCPMAHVTYFVVGPNKRACVLAFITRDREGITFCHTLRFGSKKTVAAASTALGTAFVDASKRRSKDRTLWRGRERERVCVCVCGRERERERESVCVCVCVCESV